MYACVLTVLWFVSAVINHLSAHVTTRFDHLRMPIAVPFQLV